VRKTNEEIGTLLVHETHFAELGLVQSRARGGSRPADVYPKSVSRALASDQSHISRPWKLSKSRRSVAALETGGPVRGQGRSNVPEPRWSTENFEEGEVTFALQPANSVLKRPLI
jgi:hypothetical protein